MRRILPWLVRALFAAALLGVLDLVSVLLVAPPARSVLALPIFLALTSVLFVVGAPAAVLAALLEPSLARLRLPHPRWLLAGAVFVGAAGLAIRMLHRAVAGIRELEFDAATEQATDLATLALLALALALLGAVVLPAVDRLLLLAPRLARPRVTLMLILTPCILVAGGIGPLLLRSIHDGMLIYLCLVGALAATLWLVRLALPQLSARVRSGGLALALSFSLLGPGALSVLPEANFLVAAHAPLSRPVLRALARLADFDGDGVPAAFLLGEDCAPFDPERSPVEREVPGDGRDQDCRGSDASPRSIELPPPELWTGCVFEPPLEGPSFVFITIDTLRADVLSREDTPGLAALAGRSAWFSRAYAPAPRTLPTLGAILGERPMTDLKPGGLLRAKKVSLPRPFPMELRDRGYRVIGIQPFELPRALLASFDRLDEFPTDARPRGKRAFRSADTTTRGLYALQTTPEDTPLFLWLHYPDAHAPYLSLDPKVEPPDDDYRRYLEEVRYVDFHVERMLAGLAQSSRADKTIVVVTADHGEDLREWGTEGHGPFVYETSLHVPLALFVPGCPSVLVEEPVSLIDIMPTLRALFGEPVDRYTLLHAVRGVRRPFPVVGESLLHGELRRAVIDRRYKLHVDVIRGGRLLFDLETDPSETRSIYGRGGETQRMEALYQRWLDRPLAP